MFRITSEAGRIRYLTTRHGNAVLERMQDDAMPFEECEPACMHRDPFVCSCHAYEETDTPLEAIPMPGYCNDVAEVVCTVCGMTAHCIAPFTLDDTRCFDCLELNNAVQCCGQWIPATLGHGAMCGYCGITYINSIRQD